MKTIIQRGGKTTVESNETDQKKALCIRGEHLMQVVKETMETRYQTKAERNNMQGTVSRKHDVPKNVGLSTLSRKM